MGYLDLPGSIWLDELSLYSSAEIWTRTLKGTRWQVSEPGEAMPKAGEKKLFKKKTCIGRHYSWSLPDTCLNSLDKSKGVNGKEKEAGRKRQWKGRESNVSALWGYLSPVGTWIRAGPNRLCPLSILVSLCYMVQYASPPAPTPLPFYLWTSKMLYSQCPWYILYTHTVLLLLENHAPV